MENTTLKYSIEQLQGMLADLILSQNMQKENFNALFQETHREIKAIAEQSKEQSKEIDRRFLETDKKFQETDRRFLETDRRVLESDQKIKQMREADREEFKALRDKDSQETRALKQMIFGLGKNLGKITEDYFYYSVSSDRNIAGVQYDYIARNLKIESKGMNGEYDIVLINSSRLLVIEVKQKPHINDIEKFIFKQLPNFKKLFPIYSHFTVYGAIAGMTFENNALEYALKNGLYVLTQNQNSKNVQILNEENFSAREF
jgi:hypothetical protein